MSSAANTYNRDYLGTLEPVWKLFDLTPEGRPGDWDEQLSYS